MHTVSLARFNTKHCYDRRNTGSVGSQTNYHYVVVDQGSFRLSSLKACHIRMQPLLQPVATHFTLHQLETVSPGQTGTSLTEPMNKADNGLNRNTVI